MESDLQASMLAELENIELWTELWKGSDKDRVQERLIMAYLPLARKILSRLLIRLPSHVRAEDLLNSALIGLNEAIGRFDPKNGINFEAFATRRIRGAILDELRACDPLTRTQRDRASEISRTIDRWTADHGAIPETSDIAEAMDVSAGEIESAMDRAQPWISLDAPIQTNGTNVLLVDALCETSMITPDQEVQRNDIRVVLRRIFRQLADKEQRILYLYYYEDLTLREIAEVFELTEARVCQIHALIVRKLKAALTLLESNVKL